MKDRGKVFGDSSSRSRQGRLNTWRPHQATRSRLRFSTSPFSFALSTPGDIAPLFHSINPTRRIPTYKKNNIDCGQLKAIKWYCNKMYNTFFNYHLNRKQQHQADSIVLFLASASNSTWWRCVGGQIRPNVQARFSWEYTYVIWKTEMGIYLQKKSTTAVRVLDDSEPRPLETICGGKRLRLSINTVPWRHQDGYCSAIGRRSRSVDVRRSQLKRWTNKENNSSISIFNFPWCRFIANNAKTQDSKQFNVAFIFCIV